MHHRPGKYPGAALAQPLRQVFRLAGLLGRRQHQRTLRSQQADLALQMIQAAGTEHDAARVRVENEGRDCQFGDIQEKIRNVL